MPGKQALNSTHQCASQISETNHALSMPFASCVLKTKCIPEQNVLQFGSMVVRTLKTAGSVQHCMSQKVAPMIKGFLRGYPFWSSWGAWEIPICGNKPSMDSVNYIRTNKKSYIYVFNISMEIEDI